jgi:hypothetical protein
MYYFLTLGRGFTGHDHYFLCLWRILIPLLAYAAIISAHRVRAIDEQLYQDQVAHVLV